ncbi:MAG: DEAD/DEAH box helicase [Gemmatimonadales bacterium]|jgi:ATP-dependent RNA helicase DeaD
MYRFEDLKLPAPLIADLRELGFREPSALQREAVPAIARGTTVVGVASAGSGKTLSYGLALANRLDTAVSGPQALVLRPTDDRAAATAEALYELLHGRGLAVTVVRPQARISAHIVVASPSALLAAIEHSAIKLDGLRTLVVDGLSAMVELGALDALETLTSQVPKDAQRVLLTSELNPPADDYIERHARRARRLTYLPADAPALPEAVLEYCATPRALWLPALARALEVQTAKGAHDSIIHCRFQREAESLSAALTVRGFDSTHSAATLRVGVEAVAVPDAEPAARHFWWGAPMDIEGLLPGMQESPKVVTFIEPRELVHLHRMASTLAVRLTAAKLAPPTEAHRSAQQTRDQIHEAIRTRDLEPYLLLIDPLLEEHSAAEVAAAATALLRERAPESPAKPLPAWTRLYFGVGRRDGVRPADFVGAITGESPVTGDRIGRIEIRDTYSSVEVAASVADQVIKSLARATIRGRPASVRVFRE